MSATFFGPCSLLGARPIKERDGFEWSRLPLAQLPLKQAGRLEVIPMDEKRDMATVPAEQDLKEVTKNRDYNAIFRSVKQEFMAKDGVDENTATEAAKGVIEILKLQATAVCIPREFI